MHKTNVFMLLARGRIALTVPAAYMPVIMTYEREGQPAKCPRHSGGDHEICRWEVYNPA